MTTTMTTMTRALMPQHQLGGDARRRRRRSAGFSFTEVLFAVMVLGIGFIMIAAIFPVTIRQTQTTMEETNAAIQGKAALAYLQSIASEVTFPVTAASPNAVAKVVAFNEDKATAEAFHAIRGNYISSINPRLAWVPLYMRGYDANGNQSAFAQVFMIPVQSRVRSQYYTQPPTGQLSDLEAPTGGSGQKTANLEAHKVELKMKWDTTEGVGLERGLLEITSTASSTLSGPECAAAGAYVVIAEGTYSGRVYQLGTFDADLNQWTLAAGGDMNFAADAPTGTVTAFIVGKGKLELDGSSEVGGSAQDTGIYIGFVQIPAAALASGH
jgi:hypothetical protein